MKSWNLENNKAFVSGSCEGIGLSIAKLLSSLGCELILHDKDSEQKCVEALRKIDLTKKRKSSYVVGDFGSQSDLQHVISKLKGVDILVLNASTQVRVDFEAIEKEVFDTHANTNLWSSIALIQHVLPEMKAAKWGRIITIGSIQDLRPHPQMAVYACLKAATSNLVRNLALQYSRFGITINNVSPGVVATARNEEALKDSDYAAEILKKIPIGVFANPDDCAGIVAFLASNFGAYITGQTIYCDGGMNL